MASTTEQDNSKRKESEMDRDALYDAICVVIDEVKTDERNKDTDEYASEIMDAITQYFGIPDNYFETK
jgi:hypothetical protein